MAEDVTPPEEEPAGRPSPEEEAILESIQRTASQFGVHAFMLAPGEDFTPMKNVGAVMANVPTPTPRDAALPRAWHQASLPERAVQMALAWRSLREAEMPDDEAGAILRMLIQAEYR